MKPYKVENYAFEYEVINYKRKDGLFNTYIQKTSKLSGAYMGESTYSIGVKEPYADLTFEDIKGGTYYK